MIWMRNKENNFPIRTLIWRPAANISIVELVWKTEHSGLCLTWLNPPPPPQKKKKKNRWDPNISMYLFYLIDFVGVASAARFDYWIYSETFPKRSIKTRQNKGLKAMW